MFNTEAIVIKTLISFCDSQFSVKNLIKFCSIFSKFTYSPSLVQSQPLIFTQSKYLLISLMALSSFPAFKIVFVMWSFHHSHVRLEFKVTPRMFMFLSDLINFEFYFQTFFEYILGPHIDRQMKDRKIRHIFTEL